MVRGYSLEMCVLFLLMIFGSTTEAIGHRSFTECDVQTGAVYYDPIGKVCRCNRKLCYSSRGHRDADVREEECVPLDIKCDIGMEPDPTETKCVPCKNGMFKSEEGCEWCRPFTVCRDTEWTAGNRTTDTECTVHKPREIKNTTPQTQKESLSKSTLGAVMSVETTAQVPNDAFVEVGTANGSWDVSSALLYMFFGTCGGIFVALVCSSELRKLCKTTPAKDTNPTTTLGAHKEGQSLVLDPTPALGARTVGQSLVFVSDDEEVVPKVAEYNQNKLNTSTDAVINMFPDSSNSGLDFSSLINDKYSR